MKTGWLCPRCDKINSPDITSCDCDTTRPVNTYLPPNPYKPPLGNDHYSLGVVCPTCKISFDDAMSYACGNYKCPMMVTTQLLNE